MSTVLNTIIPVFGIVAVGYWLAARRPLHLPTLSDLTLLVASPCLMFTVLGRADVDARDWQDAAGGVVWIVGGTGLLAYAYYRSQVGRGVGRGALLPAVFWNAGNMGLACSRLAFGDEGLEIAAIIFVANAILSSSLGIWIAKGENGLSEVLRMPLVYASLGGLGLAVTGTTLPPLIREPIEMLADLAIPLMLLNLGFQLRHLELSDVHHSAATVGIRMLGGVACAASFVWLFDVTGVARQVLLLQSVMPPAVINVVYAQRYDADAPLVASSIVLGTLLSLVTIPAVLLIVA